MGSARGRAAGERFNRGELPRTPKDRTAMADVPSPSPANPETGPDGEIRLVGGEKVALRYWDEGRTTGKGDHANDYETVGFALEGGAVVHVEGKATKLTPGASWCVPAGAKHHYEVAERFKAVEATSPPARD